MVTPPSAAERPIGVFDSGVGGLTVLRELIARLPDEGYTYFGDTARVPYGAKSPETVLRYAREAAAFLLGRDVKLLVVACNTATAHALDVLEYELPIPVVGVIEPGARAAVQATRRGRIGVIGTAGTIASGAYDLAVRRMLGTDARVYAQACPLFVPLIEEGLLDHPATHLIAEEYLAPLREMDIDVLILGCTHYPLLRSALQNVMGPDVVLVDSGAETAGEVARLLAEHELHRTAGPTSGHHFVASDSALRFREVGQRLLGAALGGVELVDVEGAERAA
jgi:glutamate racemase